MNDTLRNELLTMVVEDRQVRAELAADGSLFEGYHPRMREVPAATPPGSPKSSRSRAGRAAA